MKQASNKGTTYTVSQGQFCQRCGAWRGQLGLEPTVELYIEHLMEILREVWRVLRDDGTLWLNLGSSYWGGKGKSGYELPREAEERKGKGETFQTAHNVPGYIDMRPADGRDDMMQLRQDLTPDELTYVLQQLAMAACIEVETEAGSE